MKLTVFWIRHSVSKANISSLYQKAINFFMNNKDSELTEKAENCSCSVGKDLNIKIKKSQLVGCSVLRRAIQTAILMFPEKFKEGKIKVMPGIAEYNDFIIQSPTNKNYDIETNKKFLVEWCQEVIKEKNCLKLNEYFKDKKSIVKAVNSLYKSYNLKVWDDIRDRHYVEEDIFIEALKKYLKRLEVKKIAIVSHSNYMRDHIMSDEFKKNNKALLNKKNKLYNNQIFEKEYNGGKKEIKLYNLGCKITKNKDVKKF